MAMKTHEIEIDGVAFTVSPLPFEKAQSELVDLMDLAGPAVSVIVQAVGAHAGDPSKIDMSAFAPVVPLLASKLRDGKLTKLMRTFLASARIDGRELVKEWDIAFAGDLDTAWKLFFFALKVNYARLFSGLRATPNAAKAPESQSPTT